MNELLAKSPHGNQRIPLRQHTRDVMNAAEALFSMGKSPSRLGRSWLAFFDLGEAVWPVFHANLLAACALHDWGKANDGFQKAIGGNRDAQAIRHEHLSALMIGLPAVTAWLSKEPNLDTPLILSAVLTHHLKASGKRDGWATAQNGRGRFQLLHQYDEFAEVVKLVTVVSTRLDPSTLDLSAFPEWWSFGKPPNDVREHRTRIQDRILEPFREALRTDKYRNRLLLAVRAALIAADAAGSGLVRVGQKVTDWIEQNVTGREPLTKEKVWEDVIEKRVREMTTAGKWHDKGDGKKGWNDFQIACDDLPDRALLLAPCGSGKTLAAWRWIAARLEKRPAGHVLFLYPTRATAREGFKDYVSWAPEAEVALMHGTSGFDLSGMFENPPDGDERKGRTYEMDRRLYSLAYWPRRMFSATVDQFLAFMQYGYGPVCMLPVLADSVVVIDEVHSFDRNMFAALKDFLTNFKVPVLCMTATLNPDRRDDLIACGLTPPMTWPSDLQEVARKTRYRLRRVTDRAAAAAEVRNALKDLKGRTRVLWVVNQVKRVHAILREFTAGFDPTSPTSTLSMGDVPVICYHSRFKLTDRVNRHANLMKALKDQPGPALGVTTQVCEMSLDIDVDLLVTEECPVTSLMQRMGRCNREPNPRSMDRSGDVVVYPPEDGDDAPYSANDLKGRQEFLEATDGKELSQEKLEAVLLAIPCPDPEGDSLSRFLTSGPYAVGPKEDDGEGFREGNDFNRPCVLLSDVRNYITAAPVAQPGFVVPVPRGKVLKREEYPTAHAELPGYLGVASDGYYHPALGFCDFPLTEWRAG